MRGKYVTERLSPGDEGIARAARILEGGGLVAVPTETVYGLAARADDADAVASIYQAKGRPSFNPLIVHVADMESAERLAVFDDRARLLARKFWPGPLTLVLPRREDAPLADAITAGLPTVALRVPAHPLMQAVLNQSELPLAAPSANVSESVSPTTAEHVLATLEGRIDAVLDGGPCERGLESSIVVLRNFDGDTGTWQMLRPGPIGEAEIEALLGPASGEAWGIEAPGQMTRHYSPGKPLRLGAKGASGDEYMIGFGEVQGDVTLSARSDLAEAASRLYACLHESALSDRAAIAVAAIPDEGLGRAINDRLRRAAAPRD